MRISRDELEASICKDSFFDFVKRFWGEIISETPVWNWHIPFLCRELQRVAELVFERKPKKYDLIINISPGTTKSTLCTVMFPAWCWSRDPTIRHICGSYSSTLADAFGTLFRKIVSSEKYRRLFPHMKLTSESVEMVQNGSGGWRRATSTGGTVQGMHGHFIIIDDPINPNDALSAAVLQQTNNWFDHTLSTRKVSREITPQILVMQRLHQNDPTGHLLEKKGGVAIRHIRLPAEIASPVLPRGCRAYYKEGLFDPVRLPRGILDAAKIELGEYAYAGQYLQSPVPRGGGLFHVDQLLIEQHPAKLLRVVRYWDKAATISLSAAWTVGVKMGLDKNGRFWILDVIRGRWEPAERERIIKQTAMMDGVGVRVGVEQEPGSGGKESAQNTLRNLRGFSVHLDRPVGDKARRADPFAAQVNGGNVRMVLGDWNRVYLDEMGFFPVGTTKDQVDGSSGAFSMLVGRRVLGGVT